MTRRFPSRRSSLLAVSLAAAVVSPALPAISGSSTTPEAHAQSSALSAGSSSSFSTNSAPWFGPLSSALGQTFSSAGSSARSSKGSSAGSSEGSSAGSSGNASSGSSTGGSSELSSTTLKPDKPLPDKPGALVAREKVGSSRNERILYTSTNERGQIVPVSGAIYPAKNSRGAQGNKGRKGTVILAPGTRGMGDQCAPSAGSSMLLGLDGSSVNVNYEAPIAQRLANEGYQVVVTDYIGLGTPGVHTYLNRVDQGHAVIDAARAAADPDEKVFFYGYSQGGGATAAAGELQPEYAPDLNLVGIFAGAPPANPETMLTQGNAATLAPVMAMVIASYSYSYPEFRQAVGEQTTAAANRYLATVAASCLVEGTGSSMGVDKPVLELAANDERVLHVLRLNRLGAVPVRAPILIAQSSQDNVVPYAQGEQLADDYRALGSDVQFLSIPLSDASSRAGLGHVAPAITQSGEVIRWMNERFND